MFYVNLKFGFIEGPQIHNFYVANLKQALFPGISTSLQDLGAVWNQNRT